MIARSALILLVCIAALGLRAHGASAQAPAAPASAVEVEPAPAPPAAPSAGPRLELSLLGAPFGAGAGALFCGLIECSEARGFAASLLVGAGLGAGTAALATRGVRLEYATAQAIEGGAFWGLTTPIYIWLLAVPNGDGDGDSAVRGLLAGMLFGELIGMGVGALAERTLRPSSGAVALANSGALWLSAMAVLIAFAPVPDLSTDSSVRALGGSLLGAQLLGLGIGGLLGQRFEARRAQVWLSDVGAVLLGGTLSLLAWMIAGEGVSAAAIMSSAAMGLGVGFAATYTLTEFLPRRRRRVLEEAAAFSERFTLGALPLRGGGGLQLRARLR